MSGLESALRDISALLQAAQFKKAETLARRLLKKHDNVSEVHLLMGKALVGRGALKPAMHYLRRAHALRATPDTYLSVALASARLGDIDEAIGTLLEMVSRVPGAESESLAFDVLDRLGFERARANDFSKAAAIYRASVSMRPDSVHALTNLGVALYNTGAHAEASSNLRRALDVEPGHIMRMAYYAMTLRALGQAHEAVLGQILDAPSGKDLDTSIQMWAALQRDDPARAFSYTPASLNVLPYVEMPALCETAALHRKIDTLPPLRGAVPANEPRPLICAGMDGAYADVFAAPLIASALAKCPTCDVHLHIMNPLNAAQCDMAQRFPEGRVTVSYEDTVADKVLYSTRRFVRFAQIIRGIERTALFVDADVEIKGDIVSALPAHADVMLYVRRDQPWAHQMFHAGFMAFAAAGRGFLDFIASYILHFEERGSACWYLDQMALAAAQAWFQRNEAGVSIKEVPSYFVDWGQPPSADSLIWHLKGAQKDASKTS